MKNKLFKIFSILLLVCVCWSPSQIKADEYIDEIKNFEITVEPNEDSTLRIQYHIEWLVLDDKIGPLIWVDIGVPNKHIIGFTPLSENIKEMEYQSSSKCMRAYLNKEYYKNEVAIIDFEIYQDYMWTLSNDDYALCSFTPAWFDYANVDNLTIKWKSDKIEKYDPAGIDENGYIVWNTSLKGGERFTVNTYYQQDAFAFDYEKNTSLADDYQENNNDINFFTPFILIFSSLGTIITLFVILSVVRAIFETINDEGFTCENKKTIKKTKIKYYSKCPSCGATREEGVDICPYCRTSFIESEEVIEEDNPEYKEYKDTAGSYATSSPNTYVNVIVHNTRVRTPRPRSSCAHSSCAHSSCASSCACACASSGGGRAGCSVKNFYRTGLTIEQINKRNKLRNTKNNTTEV